MIFRFLLLVICLGAAAFGRQLPPGPSVYSGTATSLLQDRGGYLWIGTAEEGVLRYDGRSLVRIAGAPPGRIEQIVEDSRGYLWVATVDGLVVTTMPLEAYPPGAEVRLRDLIGSRRIPADASWSLAADTSGNVWCGVNPLWRLALAGSDSLVSARFRVGDGWAASICGRRNGEIWVALGDGSCRILTPGTTAPSVAEIPSGDTVCAGTNVFFETAEGVLYGGRPDGMLWKLAETPHERRLIPVGHFPPITALASASDGSLCVGTSRGIFRGDATARPRGFTQPVDKLLLDREGNLWVAPPRGLVMIPGNDGAFTRLHRAMEQTPAVLPGPGDEEAFWADGGIPALCEGDSCTEVQAPELRGARLLCTDEEGRLWLYGSGSIFCLAPGQAPLPPRALRSTRFSLGSTGAMLGIYPVTKTVSSARVLEMQRDSLGEQTLESIWFAGEGFLCCLAGDEWFSLDTASGLPDTPLSHSLFDGKGRLAAAAAGYGIIRSEHPVSLQALSLAAGEYGPQNRRQVGRMAFRLVRKVSAGFSPAGLIWSDGRYWIGSPESIVVFNPDVAGDESVIPLSSGGGLSCMAEESHTIWLGTRNGLLKVDADRLAVSPGPSDGLLEPDVRSLAVGPTGAIYLGHPSGATVYRPWLDRRNAVPPHVHFTGIVRRGNDIDLEWTAVTFRTPDRVRYRTRLAGYDDEWSAPAARNFTRYTSLPARFFARTYTFEVLASNGDGVWSAAPLTYAFSVEPPWYLRWWSLGAGAALLAAAVIAASGRKSRELRKRNLALRRLVELQNRETESKGEAR